ncbi:MAG: DsrE family protein, partial [Pseudomonadales bacterium]|nr:DsrE family protein [Pseudomonadales bacterium]
NTGDGRGELSAQGFGVRRGWQSLTRTNGTELLVCSASGSRRGIPPSALASCFISSGLGQLAAMTLESDRLVCF